VSWFGDSEVFDPKKPLRRKHFTIYNAINTEQIAEAVRSSDRDGLRKSLSIENKKVIGFVGRLRREKGLDILIDAFSHIHLSQPDTVLVVVGNGPDRTSLEQRAASLGVDAQIKWLGQKKPEEVYELYGIMDVVAVPSRFEGFGLTAAEALAAGVPVVGSAIDGLEEIITQNVTGFLVSADDSTALTQAISRLLDDEYLAHSMGIRGKKRIEDFFSLKIFDSLIRALYQKVLLP
jgi:glycosyltransferase involved in cell wall biosynthesis